MDRPNGKRPRSAREGAQRHPLPETLEEAERLAAFIERAVESVTSGNVRNLHVEVQRDHVLLDGRCDSFYTKQKAQHAAMRAISEPRVAISELRELTNRIEVT